VTLPPLRYLSAADIAACMPPVHERLHLAELTLVALADGSAELPPKIAIHPRGPSSFGHAMPAHLRGDDPTGHDDLVGMKWVVGHPGNGVHGGPGLPTIFATIVMNDPSTGFPLAILDGGPITAARTAAVSGVALRRFAPDLDSSSGRGHRVGLIGAGVQGRSHLEVIGHALPGADLWVFDRDHVRAEALVVEARTTPGIATAHVAPGAREAVLGADVVVTVASFGPVHQVMTNDWLQPDALVVPVDYATYCAAEVARDAGLFLVDEIGQFLANREAGLFDDYPDPTTTLGAAILDGVERPGSGRVVATHLGTGLADLVFGRAIVRAAAAAGRGTIIPR
jgi:ornithine cyclodeaminase/alanine dehydrogenase-like protein (mu-crystallin family)